MEIANKYTADATGLIKMMNEIYLHLQHRAIKSRFTRIRTKYQIIQEMDIQNTQNQEEK